LSTYTKNLNLEEEDDEDDDLDEDFMNQDFDMD
jgi:hypothetical protein